jgi:DNA mismatch repair protein MutS
MHAMPDPQKKDAPGLLTPVLRQYHELKGRHADSILLFRLGDFYEMFYEDALAASKALDIALTARHRGTANEAPMCGFPAKAAESYIARLVRAGHRVAICEQLGDPETSKGPVERDVVRVVTAGTAVEDELLEAKANSFLASACAGENGFGLAFADLSTGEFQNFETASEEEFREILRQIQPREILYPEGMNCRIGSENDEDTAYTALAPERFSPSGAEALFRAHFRAGAVEGAGFPEKPLAAGASGALLSYMLETQKRNLPHFQEIRPFERSYMTLDAATQRNLELFRNLQDGGRAGTLLWVLDSTVTAMGGRALRQWMNRPLLRKEEIETRLDAVEEWLRRGQARSRFRDQLHGIHDMERLTARVAMETAHARDMAALRDSLAALPALCEMLAPFESSLCATLRGAVDLCEELHAELKRALADSPPLGLREGGLLKDGCDAELDERRALRRNAREYLAGLERRERQSSGIDSLKVGYNRVHGYYIEVPKGKTGRAPERYERRQTLVNAERYITPELKEYEAKLLGAEEWIKEREYERFCELRRFTAGFAGRLQQSARALAALDALASLAEAAGRRGYCRPLLSAGDGLRLKAARHPVVEALAAREGFVPNDLSLDCRSRQILLITGPNMGGKSTYLRQAALAAVMAQMGSFVAAEEAEIGLVDRVFTRVGASDNLARGQSTFMVEMQETANIMKNATPRSLIVLDEVGRGTGTFDGLSLAWAVVEYLHENPKVAAKTLFATHYLELTQLAQVLPRVANVHFTVREWGDKIIFLRRVAEGAADKSYGIHVAELAGMPGDVTVRAREVLGNLERGATMLDGMPALLKGEHRPQTAHAAQKPLFLEMEESLGETLRRADIEAMTPIEALNFLAGLKRRVAER